METRERPSVVRVPLLEHEAGGRCEALDVVHQPLSRVVRLLDQVTARLDLGRVLTRCEGVPLPLESFADRAKRFAHLHEGCAEALKILIQDHREWFEGQGEDVNARSSQLGENPWRWQLVGPCEEPVRPTAPEFHTPPPPTRPRPSDDTSIWRVGLPSRTRNALLRVGVTTVGELAASSDKDLLAIPNFGPQALREVHEALERREKEPERQEA